MSICLESGIMVPYQVIIPSLAYSQM